MRTVKARMNGIPVEVPYNYTILQAAGVYGIDIPTLCHMKHLTGEGTCRICMVEANQKLVAACSTRIQDGDVIETESPQVIEDRKGVLDLFLSYHRKNCDACLKNKDCKLQEYCERYGVESSFFENLEPELLVNDWNPWFIYDANRCILCQKCVEVCHRLVGRGAIDDPTQSGMRSIVSAVFNMDWADPYCETCGNCVSVCPVGALVSKNRIPHVAAKTRTVRTTCNQCGMGCQMDLLVQDHKVVDVLPAMEYGEIGLLCAKGKDLFSYYNQGQRVQAPMIRKNGILTEVSWGEALEAVCEKIATVKQRNGTEAIAGIASAKLTNEALYLFQKFIRVVGETNQVYTDSMLEYFDFSTQQESDSRIGEYTAESGFLTSMGYAGMTNPVLDVMKTDVILVVCSDTSCCPPVLDMQIRQAVRRGKKLIVMDSKGTEYADIATISLCLTPGTHIALVNGLLHVLFRDHLVDRDYMLLHTEGSDELRACVDMYTPEIVCEICGIDVDAIESAASIYGNAARAMIFFAYGGKHDIDEDLVAMSMSNLAMATGNVGRRGCGVNACLSHGNESGARDMGVDPDYLPGNQRVMDFPARLKVQRTWRAMVNEVPGKSVIKLTAALCHGQIKLLYLAGEDCCGYVQDCMMALKAADTQPPFLIMQTSFMDEQSTQADILLPAATFVESEGTFTSMERKVNQVRAGISLPEGVKHHWEMIAALLERSDLDVSYNNVGDVWEEIRKLIPDYAGISYGRLAQHKEGIYTPCPSESHKGAELLMSRAFMRRGGRGLLAALEWSGRNGACTGDYPITLMTYSAKYHYCRLHMTGRLSGRRNLIHKVRIELHEGTGRLLQLQDGDEVMIHSSTESVLCVVQLVDTLPKAHAWVSEEDGRRLALWESSKEPTVLPGYQKAQVRIEKI